MANFESERVIELAQIHNRLEEIRSTIYSQRQPIPNIEANVTGLGKGPDVAPAQGWKPFQVLDRWGGFDETTWFRMNIKIPSSMKGGHVVAFLRPGGESLAYVNGKPFQGLDVNRDDLHLVDKAKGGESFDIVLESVPSVRFDHHHYFEYADLAVMNRLVWDFWWDCAVLVDVIEHIEKDTAPRRRLLDLVNRAVKMVDLQHVATPAYLASITQAQRFLRKEVKAYTADYQWGALALVAQSHIDTAWLWPLRETKRKCARTWATVLNMMERYPEYRFFCSQPAQYEWMQQYYPDIFTRIKKRAKEGRWEPGGAMWVECDCNVPCGESFVRQLLYGNRFWERQFGVRSRVAYCPDTFGYSWALPQIFKKAQLDVFITTKLAWSQFTEFPYGLFQWEGVDGTRLLGYVPAPTYTCQPVPKTCNDQWERFPHKDRVEELLYLYGHGDGGGGPVAADMEYARRMGDLYGVPRCRVSRLDEHLARLRADVPFDTLPIWNGELYLERHRACQTTQARTKRNNRKCEGLLHDAEFLGSLALISGAAYDAKRLYEAWRIVLTNQFHDILPGSSITEVYAQTEIDYTAAKDQIGEARHQALQQLTKRIDTRGEGSPIVVFNTLSWVRTDLVEIEAPLPKGALSVLGPDNEPVPHQRLGASRLLFEARALPPLGYAVFHIVAGAQKSEAAPLSASKEGMENEHLRIRFDKNGALANVFDKAEQREILPKGQRGNHLQLFDDRPRGDDAWDIDFNFAEHMWEPRCTGAGEVIEAGPLRASVRFVYRTEKSTITQCVTMYAGIPRVDFVTEVDWHEKRTLLKVAFPVDVRTSRATFEIQYGAIERPTHRNTAADQGRFEVAAQRWADLSEGDYGVSLLNDSKYGYDVEANVLRLSLLRAPVDPDPTADEGHHAFTYSLYPHAWSWRNGTVKQAAELNAPLIAAAAEASAGALPAIDGFASLDAEHVIVDWVKRHEDSDAIIVRLYEAHGQRGDVAMTFARTPKRITECDLMEENDSPVKLRGNTLNFYVTPFEIRTFKIAF